MWGSTADGAGGQQADKQRSQKIQRRGRSVPTDDGMLGSKRQHGKWLRVTASDGTTAWRDRK